MGHVAIAAGGFLVDRLGATELATLAADSHFELDRARVEDGIVVPGHVPRGRFYGWTNPNPDGRDLILFVGEAQPHKNSYDYTRKVLDAAARYAVRRVVTFASMVTPAPPGSTRVLAVATGPELLQEVVETEPGVATLRSGEIHGLNGTLLAAAATSGVEALGLLGEVPRIAANVPYLRASHAVLRVFCQLAGVELDLDDLGEQADSVDEGLHDLMRRVREARGEEGTSLGLPGPETEEFTGTLSLETLAQIEDLFLRAASDHGVVEELKRALDHHGVFADYEDRFLDLFRSD